MIEVALTEDFRMVIEQARGTRLETLMEDESHHLETLGSEA